MCLLFVHRRSGHLRSKEAAHSQFCSAPLALISPHASTLVALCRTSRAFASALAHCSTTQRKTCFSAEPAKRCTAAARTRWERDHTPSLILLAFWQSARGHWAVTSHIQNITPRTLYRRAEGARTRPWTLSRSCSPSAPGWCISHTKKARQHGMEIERKHVLPRKRRSHRKPRVNHESLSVYRRSQLEPRASCVQSLGLAGARDQGSHPSCRNCLACGSVA